MQQHAAAFLARSEDAAGADLPQFFKDEFDAFLECGILAHGFLRLRCGAGDRQALEQPCRYITRPALANERVQTNAAGQVVLKLRTAWCDGTTHLVMSPLEFMQRLAALAPRRRLHLIRLHGVLAPNAKLLKQVFEIDMEHCPNCGGEPKNFAAILEQLDIENIPEQLGLQARAPPHAPARGQALQAALLHPGAALSRRQTPPKTDASPSGAVFGVP